ncbi:hypothetical protein [Streptomyces sp. NPDC056323]|uniref:hypothetical protein n=1 Tax=Streptomyces sp. NPDC056323 TaxID=3345784 RepID=UPI0035D91740
MPAHADEMDADTVNRELSIARKAIGWWQRQCWIDGDPTIGGLGPRSGRTPDIGPTGSTRAPSPSPSASPGLSRLLRASNGCCGNGGEVGGNMG